MTESTKTSETSPSQLLPRCSSCGCDNAWSLLDTEYRWWCGPCRDNMDRQFKYAFVRYRAKATAEVDD
jgi:hypothetical protein